MLFSSLTCDDFSFMNQKFYFVISLSVCMVHIQNKEQIKMNNPKWKFFFTTSIFIIKTNLHNENTVPQCQGK